MTKYKDIKEVNFNDIVDTGTEGTKIALGTTAQRGSTAGQIRFNSTTGLAEYYDGTAFKSIDAPPTVSSISPTSLGQSVLGSSQSIVITGSNFSTTVTAFIVGNDGTEYTPASTTRNSSTQVTITTPTNLTNTNEPYDIKITNASSLSGTLADALAINDTPVFATASGSLGTLFDNDRTASNLTAISFSDEESTPTVSVTSGSLPAGITLNSNGTFSGTANAVSNNTTSNFTVTATDGAETASRAYSITVSAPIALSVSGTIYTGIASNITVTATNTDGTVDIIFKEGGTTLSTLSNQTLSGNSKTVAVPSAVYNQSAGDTITITVADGTNVSSGVNITVSNVPTGGSISSSGGYRIHTFNSSSTFTVPSGLTLSNVEYVVVAGGGGVGSRQHSGGGGGGGYRSSVVGESSGRGASAESRLTMTAGNYTVTIGGGGTSSNASNNTNSGASNGGNSVFGMITSNGGGYGGTYDSSGASGGCGGASGSEGGNIRNGGSGTSGQGYNGGDGADNQGGGSGGGGGGAGSQGGDGSGNTVGGTGGSGVTSSITGSSVGRAGGGGGGSPSGNAGSASSGGGNGSLGNSTPTSGTANKGGGAGGGGADNRGAVNGGSGIVIVRYQL